MKLIDIAFIFYLIGSTLLIFYDYHSDSILYQYQFKLLGHAWSVLFVIFLIKMVR